VVAGEEGPNQGMVTTELLHDNAKDIQMEVQEWPDEWKVPVIPKTVPIVQI
jgi:hypothetical protein